jgi:CheY-like chemotaxis protein
VNELVETQIALETKTRILDAVLAGVQDTGTGIAVADLDRIYDPFFTTKRLDQGTGLGLSTATGIVKAHGGFMQVQSALGRGSTFAVYLPIASSPSAPERPRAEGRRLRGRGERILVVDDESSIRQLYRVVLTQLGFEVVVAEDGIDGLAQVERHQASLRAIISDVLMPNMDGPTFIRTLNERGVAIPVAIASGRIEDRHAEELDRLNVSVRLGKPFTQRRLMALVDQLLVSGAAADR